MRELLTLNYDRAAEFAMAMLSREGSPAARLYRVLRADLRHVAGVPYDLSGTQGVDVLEDPDFREWASEQEKLHQVWRSLMAEGIAAGELVPYDSALVEFTIEGVFKELIRVAGRRSRGEEVPSPDDITRFMLRALLVNQADMDRVAEEAEHLKGVSDLDY